jgi:hypothetical protein
MGSRWPVTERSKRASGVFGPDGRSLTLANLPPPQIQRWVVRRKAEVVAAVRGGLLGFDEACARYALTAEELIAWQDAVGHSGVNGLRATQLRDYRRPSEMPRDEKHAPPREAAALP